MTIHELCAKYGLTQTGLARKFEIPLRTVQDWHAGKRIPPEYVVNMMTCILENESENQKSGFSSKE